jgi:thiol-disulfide isomerase/thioredoxin
MASSELFDIRSPLWRAAFDSAVSFDNFLVGASSAHRARWLEHRSRIALSSEQRNLLEGFKRRMNVLVLAGVWCGDCARQCPMLEVIARATPAIDIRFIDNQSNPSLRDELRIHGASRVPVAVTLSEDFFEVGRSGDRSLAAYRRKSQLELGDACDTGLVVSPAEELAEEVGEWVEYFERHHLLLRLSPFLRRRHAD